MPPFLEQKRKAQANPLSSRGLSLNRHLSCMNQRGSTGSQCQHVAENITTPYPTATGPWRRTHVINQPHGEEKGWVAHPPHPLVAPIPTGSTSSTAWALEVSKSVQEDACQLKSHL